MSQVQTQTTANVPLETSAISIQKDSVKLKYRCKAAILETAASGEVPK
jgi:hypothetical protein